VNIRVRRLLILAALVVGAALIYVRAAGEMPDFAVYHLAGSRVVSGASLYRASDGHYQFKYPPFAALLFVPLAPLPSEAAKAIWFAIVALAIAGSLILSRRLLPETRHGTAIGALTVLVEAKFFAHELTLGQINAVLLALMLAALHSLRSGNDRAAGLILALAISVKPYALIFLPYLVIKRRPRAWAWALAGLAVCSMMPALRYGVGPTIDLYREWFSTLGDSTPTLLASQDNVSLFGFYAKWLGADDAALPWAVLASSLVLGVLLGRLVSSPTTSERDALALDVAMLLILMPLLSPLGWDYVFLWTTPAVMLLIAAWSQLDYRSRIVLITTLVTIGASVYDLLGRARYAAFMNSSILTAAFVVLIGLLAAQRSIARPHVPHFQEPRV
jgi:hypothetical protein